MSVAVFVVALVAGAGALALWVDVRFPGLAPQGLRGRAVAAGCSFLAVGVVPISATGGLATLASLLGVFLPVLCLALLASIWLLRCLADRTSARY